MFAVLTCIFVQHDLRLVLVAAIICVVASGTAFGFHGRAIKASGGLRSAWLGLTGLVAGSGVWATHFMAMLAYQPSLQIGYELSLTAASWRLPLSAWEAASPWPRSRAATRR